jgi:MFS family permease
MADPSVRPTSSLWRPLRTPTFRNLLLADIASDVGTFMQSVGAAWLMISLNASPLLVALTQTASALPYFVFALPAGAIGDIVDRRKLILSTETWMVVIAILLAALTLGGWITPLTLLLLTFALSAGDAFETPTWRALLPELVEKEDLPAAASLNGIEFNFSRAVGPGLAGIIIAATGVGAAFLLNAFSFVGVILVIARWKRARRKRTAPPETLVGATVAGLRYVRYSPAIRTLFLRSGFVIFFATGLTALLPLVARSVRNSPTIYGILLGCFGLGAVVGAVVMQHARARWSSEAVVSSGVAIYALATLAVSMFKTLPTLCAATFVGGAAWIMFISLVNVLVLNHSPDWVRARVLSVSTLVVQGAVAAGSASFGALAARLGVRTALLYAAAGTISTTTLGLFWKLPDGIVDLTTWNHWPMPRLDDGVLPDGNDSGPVLVTIEYEVSPEHAQEFIDAAHHYGRIRRRDGAMRWGIFRDVGKPDHYVETFLVHSWAEHLRQHERITMAERELEDQLYRYVQGNPIIRHLVSADEA